MDPRKDIALDQLMPTSLDDIIRSNRDRMRLYRSTDDELNALRMPLPTSRDKGVISHWCFITIAQLGEVSPQVCLTGYNAAERSSWMTSQVTGISGNAVATRSGSLYLLEGESSTELDLPFICATLNGWGIGQHFGVPAFFF